MQVPKMKLLIIHKFKYVLWLRETEILMVNDSKQSSISGGQGALLRSGLTLLLRPKEEEVSF